MSSFVCRLSGLCIIVSGVVDVNVGFNFCVLFGVDLVIVFDVEEEEVYI